jgi:hypothetical protein
LSPTEIQQVIQTGDIYLMVWTFGQPLQPVLLQTDPPEIVNPIPATDEILEASEIFDE